MLDREKIGEIARLLKKAKSVFFVTGAGISADSGLPTYRGVGGLYNDTVTDEGIPIETALAGETLKSRPELTWKYLSQIEKNCRSAKFNRAHEVIKEMEDTFERVCVLTQNIDGFHHQAGSQNVIDIHGDIHRIMCPGCGWKRTIENFSEIEIPPACPLCGKTARPDVVFFGEMLPYEKLLMLDDELAKGFDIYFSVGTTSVFPYIQEPMFSAKRMGRPTVEINPGETGISGIVDIRLPHRAAESLDAIWSEFNKN
ncbi:MAG: NAD-dependent protein deacylase [Endomicrobiales bacterium]|nr:NAD-dependent protein deacylase [Endomicrobiales bacterium]